MIISNQTISGAAVAPGDVPPILNEEIISMGVILSEKAANEVKRIITVQNLPEGTVLRVGVRGGGMQRSLLQPELRHQHHRARPRR